jgi:hypothetical protein
MLLEQPGARNGICVPVNLATHGILSSASASASCSLNPLLLGWHEQGRWIDERSRNETDHER